MDFFGFVYEFLLLYFSICKLLSSVSMPLEKQGINMKMKTTAILLLLLLLVLLLHIYVKQKLPLATWTFYAWPFRWLGGRGLL